MAVEFKNPITLTKDSTIYGHQSLDEGGFPKNAGNAKVSQILDLAQQQTLENTHVGGRNLIRGTADQRSGDCGVFKYDNSFFNNDIKYGKADTFKSSNPWLGCYYDFYSLYKRENLKVGDVVTFSIRVLANFTPKTAVQMTLYRVGSTQDGQNNVYIILGTKTLEPNKWYTYSATWAITQANLDIVQSNASNRNYPRAEVDYFDPDIYAEHKTFTFGEGNYIYIGGMKLEKGNIATDWTPAPEDAIKTVSNEYYLSSSATALSGGSWSEIAPTWVNGKYMWMRTVVTNGYGDKTYTPSENGACLSGAKGDKGASAGFGTPTASVDNNVGTPSVTVTTSGADTAKVFNFAFKNLKGNKGDAGTTTWAGITDKPTSFTPSAHNHDDRYYTESEIDTKLEGKANATHNHDDRYYTEAEITKSVTTGQLIAGKVLPRGEASDIGDSLQAFKNGYIETLDTTTVNAGSIQPKTASANIGSPNQKFGQVYVGTVNADTINTSNENISSTLKVKTDKVEIGADNESGYVNIKNVDATGVSWHIDAWQDQLRFVRQGQGASVPAYITKAGLFGAVFN